MKIIQEKSFNAEDTEAQRRANDRWRRNRVGINCVVNYYRGGVTRRLLLSVDADVVD